MNRPFLTYSGSNETRMKPFLFFPPVIAWRDAVFFPESGGKTACAVESDGAGDVADACTALAQEFLGALHAMLLGVRRDRGAVFVLESLFESGRIDVELTRKLLDGHALGNVLEQIIVHLANGLRARCAAFAFGAGDLHDALNGGVHRKTDLAVGDAVVDLLALTARVDQPAFAKDAQMMRHRGTRNAEPFGKPDAAFFAVAEDPEYFDPRPVGEHLEKLGGGFKIFVVDMCVEMCHFLLLFGNKISFFGRKDPQAVDFSCYKQYNTNVTIKQVFNCKNFKETGHYEKDL